MFSDEAALSQSAIRYKSPGGSVASIGSETPHTKFITTIFQTVGYRRYKAN